MDGWKRGLVSRTAASTWLLGNGLQLAVWVFEHAWR